MHGRTFDEFLRGYIWVIKRLQTPEHYAIATRHLLERLAAQDVTYAEITLSAGVVLWKDQDLAAVYDADLGRIAALSRENFLDCGCRAALWRRGRACASPSSPSRGASKAQSRSGSAAMKREDRRSGFAMSSRMRATADLRLVCHAGETTGPESIWAALEIGAERIGHGIAAAQDPALMAKLRESNIPLEVCISSNVCTGVVASLEEHPVRKLYDAGVPIVLNTDDPSFFRTSLTREYELGARCVRLAGGRAGGQQFSLCVWIGIGDLCAIRIFQVDALCHSPLCRQSGGGSVDEEPS